MADKLGTYITKLMTTIIDKNQDQFVKDLAYDELNRLNVDINQFLKSQIKEDEPPQKEKVTTKGCSNGGCKGKCKNKQETQLLQEEIKNG